eukprot:m51a1_g3833 putative myb domain-containing protein (413) ;mRNA; f:329114-330889
MSDSPPIPSACPIKAAELVLVVLGKGPSRTALASALTKATSPPPASRRTVRLVTDFAISDADTMALQSALVRACRVSGLADRRVVALVASGSDPELPRCINSLGFRAEHVAMPGDRVPHDGFPVHVVQSASEMDMGRALLAELMREADQEEDAANSGWSTVKRLILLVLLMIESPSSQHRLCTYTNSRTRWTEDEHRRFLSGIELYGRQWDRVEQHVGTRTMAQIRSHAQKYFEKLEKENRAEQIPPRRRRETTLDLGAALTQSPVSPSSAEFMSWMEQCNLVSPAPPPTSLIIQAQQFLKERLAPEAKALDGTETTVEGVGFGPAQQTGVGLPPPDPEVVYTFLASLFDPTQTGLEQRLAEMSPADRLAVRELMANLTSNPHWFQSPLVMFTSIVLTFLNSQAFLGITPAP